MKKADPKKLLRQARESMGLSGKSQEQLLKQAKETLGYNNAELGKALGKSEAAIKSWLSPKGAAKRREMPDGIRLLLGTLLESKK